MENFTRIENEVLEKLSVINLSGSALACALVLLRKTNGYKKEQDGISLSQFVRLIGRSKPTVCKALAELQLVNICLLVKKGKSGKDFNIYAFNKDIETWRLVKKSLLVKKKKSTSKEIETELVKKSLHTKENITKENITKDMGGKQGFSLEDFIIDFNDIRKYCLPNSKGIKVVDSKTARQFKELLKQGVTREDMQKALKSLFADKYHCETSWRYCTPEFITRSDKFSRFSIMEESQSHDRRGGLIGVI